MIDFATEEALLDWLGEVRTWARSAVPATLAEQIRYGDSPEQVIDLWRPQHAPADHLVVSIHGGAFAAEYTREINEPLVRGLTALGFAVANVEYRRIGSGGGLDATTADVEAALSALAAGAHVGSDGFAVVGHSAGGYLTLWSAAHPSVDLAIALSPVCDLAGWHASGLDEGTVAEWLGATPEQDAALYGRADLEPRLHMAAATVLMHGERDEWVPVEHSVELHRAVSRGGGAVTLDVLEDEGHFGWLDPRLPASRAVQAVLTGWRDRRFAAEPARG